MTTKDCKNHANKDCPACAGNGTVQHYTKQGQWYDETICYCAKKSFYEVKR